MNRGPEAAQTFDACFGRNTPFEHVVGERQEVPALVGRLLGHVLPRLLVILMRGDKAQTEACRKTPSSETTLVFWFGCAGYPVRASSRRVGCGGLRFRDNRSAAANTRHLVGKLGEAIAAGSLRKLEPVI